VIAFSPARHTSLLLLLLLAHPSPAHSRPSEPVVKAVFVERVTRFVTWPEKARIDQTSAPFVICIAGKSPTATAIRETLKDRKVRNKAVRMLQISDAATLPRCHVLFLASSEKDRLAKIIAVTRKHPVLTVGDTRGFAEGGVHVNFYLDRSKVRFEINREAVGRAGLKVSHLLLRYARVVDRK
jgi:YfiR/HmsC-like